MIRHAYRMSPLIRPRRISRVSSGGKRAAPERETERRESHFWGRERVSEGDRNSVPRGVKVRICHHPFPLLGKSTGNVLKALPMLREIC